MSDYLVVASGAVPEWCDMLTTATPVLFPFEARQTYFNATAFGLSRSAHWIQTKVQWCTRPLMCALADVIARLVVHSSNKLVVLILFFFLSFCRSTRMH